MDIRNRPKALRFLTSKWRHLHPLQRFGARNPAAVTNERVRSIRSLLSLSSQRRCHRPRSATATWNPMKLPPHQRKLAQLSTDCFRIQPSRPALPSRLRRSHPTATWKPMMRLQRTMSGTPYLFEWIPPRKFGLFIRARMMMMMMTTTT